jgi:hypothetical protein
MLGDDAEQANIRAGYTTCSATWPTISAKPVRHRVAACQAASEAGHAPRDRAGTRRVADLALRCGQYEQAARLLGASAGVRGVPDRSDPDVARIEQAARVTSAKRGSPR